MECWLLNDKQWDRIKDLLPGKTSNLGVTARDNRRFVEAVLWIGRTGSPWRDLPQAFGSWHTTFTRFARWTQIGVWDCVFKAASTERDLEEGMLDGTAARAHHHAFGARKKNGTQALGRSRGGFGTKIHATIDALGSPIGFTLSS